MAAQKGRSILLKLGSGASPQVFTTVSGIRSRTLSINNETVDITTSDEAPWRKMLAGAGIRSVSISGSGVFEDDSAFNSIETMAMNGSIEEFQLVFGNGDYFQGAFQVTKLDYAGEYNSEQTYTLSLESADYVWLNRA